MTKHNSERTWGYPRYNEFSRIIHLAASEWFLVKGYKTNPKYPYILADREDWRLNIILPEVSNFIQDKSTKRHEGGDAFPLHKYLHHGLSSQAMLFNLVSPLLVRHDLAPLQKVVEGIGIAWPGEDADAILEYEDRNVFNEKQGQPTSIDLAVTSQAGTPRLFFEAKFTEREFGGCSLYQQGDCDGRNPAGNLDLCYLHHIGRKYWTLMQEFGLTHGPIEANAMCILAPHYQFFRELLFAVSIGGTFILLSDDRSPVFHCDGSQGKRGLMPFLLGLLPPEIRTRVAAISIQEFVKEIRKTGRHEWIDEFALKYALVDQDREDIQGSYPS
jgi:hypothetical protein